MQQKKLRFDAEIFMPRDIHEMAVKCKKRGGGVTTIGQLYLYFAHHGYAAMMGGARPVFTERGIQPREDFVRRMVVYGDALRADMDDLLARIKDGEFESRPKHPKKTVSMKCVFITLVELGLAAVGEE